MNYKVNLDDISDKIKWFYLYKKNIMQNVYLGISFGAVTNF